MPCKWSARQQHFTIKCFLIFIQIIVDIGILHIFNFFCSYQDLDLRSEELIKEEFGAECNFDVHDAIKKLEKLSIVHRVNLNWFFF